MAKAKKEVKVSFQVRAKDDKFEVYVGDYTVEAFKLEATAHRLADLLNAAYQCFQEGDKVGPKGLDGPPVKVKKAVKSAA